MANAHVGDRSSERTQLVLDYVKWPDDYWKVDLSIRVLNGETIVSCLPLMSGVRAITPNQVQEIKHLLSLAVETMTFVDIEGDPF